MDFWNDIDLRNPEKPLETKELENASAYLYESSDFAKEEFERTILIRIAKYLDQQRETGLRRSPCERVQRGKN